ncbi:hypothetical protein OGAPHI_000072 [Ogataea philodendri]|uniref:Uncharacterized protein n=1 Tax=Ogataea philodendri TaxID=1378263 RepID=A0A9P8TB84_9ASCO|nr:uncharacterized protein OGAPHI_000072 [Ogataea philodendri]KAH3671886.1 hypothetical protein OGAPHI_000072 [Ogataea philodendri]
MSLEADEKSCKKAEEPWSLTAELGTSEASRSGWRSSGSVAASGEEVGEGAAAGSRVATEQTAAASSFAAGAGPGSLASCTGCTSAGAAVAAVVAAGAGPGGTPGPQRKSHTAGARQTG